MHIYAAFLNLIPRTDPLYNSFLYKSKDSFVLELASSNPPIGNNETVVRPVPLS